MAIEARNVTKRFGEFVALDDVSIAVSEPLATSIETSSSATNSAKRLVTLRASIATGFLLRS